MSQENLMDSIRARKLVHAHQDHTIRGTAAIMAQSDFSQVPVLRHDGTLEFVVTWEVIAAGMMSGTSADAKISDLAIIANLSQQTYQIFELTGNDEKDENTIRERLKIIPYVLIKTGIGAIPFINSIATLWDLATR